MADPGVELTIPGNYALEDVDNDDITDGNGPPADTDGLDGDGDDVLVFGWLQCGQPIAPNNGFHFRGFGYTQIGDTVESLIKYSIGWDNNPSTRRRLRNRTTVRRSCR